MTENKNLQGRCFIWGTPAEIRPCPEKELMDIVDSPRAGGEYYALSNPCPLSLDDKTKARITSWLVKQRSLGIKRPQLDEKIIYDDAYGESPGVYERANELLKLLKLECGEIGQWVRIDSKKSDDQSYINYLKMLAFSGSNEASELYYLLEDLENNHNYIKIKKMASVGERTDDGRTITLTMKGHAHLEELEKTAPVSSKVFVAMWFHSSMSKMYQEGIRPAIIDSGYEVFRVDEPKDVDKIDDRVIAEITRSQFIIADFTHGDEGARENVYYEAGFARGLGKQVISTCHEDLIEKLPFDTRQYYHIAWEENNLKDLRETLANRISAIVGDGPMKSKT